MNKKGFTFIELMIVLAIIGILVTIIFPPLFSNKKESSNIQWGYNGVTEERCISGYMFIVGHEGRITQMIGENGGVKCSQDGPSGPMTLK